MTWAVVVLMLAMVGCAVREPVDPTPTGWVERPAMPTGNAGMIAGVLDDRLCVVGGTDWVNGQKRWLDDIWLVARQGRASWSRLGRMPAAVAYGVAGTHRGSLYLHGGSDGRRTHDALWRLDRDGRVSQVARTGQRRVYAGGAIVGGRLHVVAGALDAHDLATLTATCLDIDLLTGQARSLPDHPGGAVMLPAVVAAGDELLVFGGATYNPTAGGVIDSDQAWAYSPAQRRWRRLARLPVAARGMAACDLGQGRVLIGGGHGVAPGHPPGFLAQAWVYDRRQDRYQALPNWPQAVMTAALLLDGGQVHLLGGEDQPRHRSRAWFSIQVKQLGLDRTSNP